MTQEEKELLLKDLSARLSYQPLCKKIDAEDNFCECDAPLGYSLRDLVDNKIIIKPYLRPMSSMTEEEKRYLMSLKYQPSALKWKNLIISSQEITDWLNRKMFDYRGLILKGLALEAPEGMYELKVR